MEWNEMGIFTLLLIRDEFFCFQKKEEEIEMVTT